MADRYNRRGLFVRLADEILSRSQEYLRPYLSWMPTRRGQEPPGPLTFLSSGRSWRDQLVDVARILGIQEEREASEVWRQAAEQLGASPSAPDEEGALRAVATEMGLEAEGASYVTLLESIGEELGVSREYVFDLNKYYLSAERYWTHRIAEALDIPPFRDDDELLRRVVEGLRSETGVAPERGATPERAVHRPSGSTDVGDPSDLLREIETRVRLAVR